METEPAPQGPSSLSRGVPSAVRITDSEGSVHAGARVQGSGSCNGTIALGPPGSPRSSLFVPPVVWTPCSGITSAALFPFLFLGPWASRASLDTMSPVPACSLSQCCPGLHPLEPLSGHLYDTQGPVTLVSRIKRHHAVPAQTGCSP